MFTGTQERSDMNEKEFKEGAKIIKSATDFVRKLPFYYAVIYVFLICVYLFCSDNVSTFIDWTFNISPAAVFVNIRLSRMFKFCVWHRIECSLPLIPYFAMIVDFICPLGMGGALANLIIICLLIVATIVNAFFVFRRAR